MRERVWRNLLLVAEGMGYRLDVELAPGAEPWVVARRNLRGRI